MGSAVMHFEIVAKNAPAVRQFYRDAFDWKIGHNVGGAGIADYTLVDTAADGAGIAGGIGEAPPGYDGHVTVYVDVPDVAQALERIERLGGKPMMGPDPVPGGLVIGLFMDPGGHVMGLRQQPRGAA